MTILSRLLLAGALLGSGLTGVNAQTAPQPGQKTPSTVDAPAQQKGEQPQPPKTTGAMDNAVGNVATSPDDVKRQTEGQPTAAEAAKGVTASEPKPGMTTQHSPGTVGAAPGVTPPADAKKP
jgi:hypothetical protein